MIKTRRVKRLLFAMLIAIILLGAYVGQVMIHHNFHVVTPGRVYRSGQMSASALSDVVQRWGIRTVVNLRGASPDNSWYNQETNLLGNLGIGHADFALSAGREPTDKEIETLMELIRKSPKPILMHCNGGADRSGLISALYLYILEGETARKACSELSPFYGHVPYLHWRYSIAMDRCFWKYVSAHPNPTSDDGRDGASLLLPLKGAAFQFLQNPTEARPAFPFPVNPPAQPAVESLYEPVFLVSRNVSPLDAALRWYIGLWDTTFCMVSSDQMTSMVARENQRCRYAPNRA